MDVQPKFQFYRMWLKRFQIRGTATDCIVQRKREQISRKHLNSVNHEKVEKRGIELSSQRALFGRKALILLVLQAAGKLTGRTKLQKILYLSNLCKWNVIPDYKYHNYGPFSEMVNMEIENMQNNGWVNESPFTTTNGNTSYSYRLSRAGNEIANSLVSRFEDEIVKSTIELVESLNGLTTDDLEIMATLVYLKEENKNLSNPELVKEVFRLKPRFKEKQIKDGLRVFKMLENYK